MLETGIPWATSGRVPAVFYDAGTDSGPEYTLPDQPTSPMATPVGYFQLERIK